MPILLLVGEGFSRVFIFLEQEYEEHNRKRVCVHTICIAFSISNLVTMPASYWLFVDKQEQGNFCPLTSCSLLLMESRKLDSSCMWSKVNSMVLRKARFKANSVSVSVAVFVTAS
jgi:hypothetical protein